MLNWNNNTIEENIFSTIIYIIGRLGVPIFLFLTGHLILNKKFDNENDIKRFYKKNLLPLVITTEIWIVISIIVYSILERRAFEIGFIGRYISFYNMISDNLWYMPMIFGMYLALPFVSIILNKISLKTLLIPFTVTIIVCFGTPLLNFIAKLTNSRTYYSWIDVNFLGGVYGIYILIGYLISKGILKNFKSVYLYIIAIASFIITFEMQIIARNNQLDWRIWYDLIFLLICATALFELFTRMKLSDKMKKISLYISKISLGIYFIHMILIKIISRYIDKLGIAKLYQFLIILTVTWSISVLIIAIFSKIKIIKNKIFLIKD